MSKRSKQSAVAVLVTALLAVVGSPASAGTYDVVACDADGGGRNNSWAGYSDHPAMAIYESEGAGRCDTAGSDFKGLISRTSVVDGWGVPFMAKSGAQVTAPEGALLERMWVSYRFGRADQNYHVGFYK